MGKKRLSHIDIAKGIAILAVIVGHSGGMRVVNYFIFVFHMPLFFIISGYFINEKTDTLLYIKKNTKATLIPYLLLCLGIWISECCIHFVSGIKNLGELSLSRLIGTIYASGIPVNLPNGYKIWACGFGWFLVALLLAKITVFLVIRKNDVVISFLYVCILASIGVKLKMMGFWPPFSLLPACIATFYIFIGWWMKQTDYFSRTLTLPITIIGILFWIVLSKSKPLDISQALIQQGMLSIIGSLLACFLTVTFCQWLLKKKHSNKVVRFLEWCGINSLWLFVVHGIESKFFSYYNFFEALSKKMGNQLVPFILLITVRITITCCITLLIKKLYQLKTREP